MFSYHFSTFQAIETIDFEQTVLWIFNADKIPPHVGISNSNQYFSLKANGKDENLSCSTLLNVVHRKRIPTILIELNKQISFDDIVKEFDKYSVAGINQTTCLTPISSLIDSGKSKQLSELLNNNRSLIKTTAGIYLPPDYRQLPSYSVEEIRSHIAQLKKHNNV